MWPKFDDVWRKSDGQWRPAATTGSAAEPADGVIAPTSPDVAQQNAQIDNAETAGDPSDADAMGHEQYEAYEKRIDLSGRPAQHARAWNSSTYVELGSGIAAPARPVPNKQLLLAAHVVDCSDPAPCLLVEENSTM